jgi:hypothetical protein
MVTIGNSNLPGVTTTVDSAATTGVNVSAAAEVGIVGQAYLADGTANANQVYEVRTPARARTLFGRDSLLAEAIVDALIEGAYPVYAVATAETAVTNEALSPVGTVGTLTEGPISENTGEVSFTVDGSDKTVRLIYDNPSDFVPAAGEVLLNPVTREYNLDETVDTSADADYTHYDYDAAVDALLSARAQTLDVVGILTEEPASVDYLHTQVKGQETQGNLMLIEAGAPVYLSPASYTNTFDSSRIQLLYPTRAATGESVVGGMVGVRARLGIDESPMFKRLTSVKNLRLTLSKGEQVDLVQAKVVPLADEAAGARIVEDLTCVADDNAEEDSMRQGLHRLIVDYVTEVVNVASQRFIGRLHTQATRNALRSVISSELSQLLDLQSITGYTLTVEEVDAMTASVDVGIDTVDPLRNIEASILAGRIEGQDEA